MSYRFTVTIIRVSGFGDNGRQLIEASGQSMADASCKMDRKLRRLQRGRKNAVTAEEYEALRDMLKKARALTRYRYRQLPVAFGKVIDWGWEVRIERHAHRFAELAPGRIEDRRE